MSASGRPYRQQAAHQAPLSTGFSKQEYWSGLPFSSPLLPVVPGKKEASATRHLDTVIRAWLSGGSNSKESTCNVGDLGWEGQTPSLLRAVVQNGVHDLCLQPELVYGLRSCGKGWKDNLFFFFALTLS